MTRSKLRFGRPVTVPPVVQEKLADRASCDPDDDENRRAHPRLLTDGHAQVTLEGQIYNVVVTDMGDGGMCCQPLPYWIRRGDPILVHLRDQVLVGRVAWRRSLSEDDDDLLVGVRFSRPHPELTRLDDVSLLDEASL